jgi:hypothetical protein
VPRRLIRNSKLTNRQLNEFVKYFALEVPASRAAKVMGINPHSAELMRFIKVVLRHPAGRDRPEMAFLLPVPSPPPPVLFSPVC